MQTACLRMFAVEKNLLRVIRGEKLRSTVKASIDNETISIHAMTNDADVHLRKPDIQPDQLE